MISLVKFISSDCVIFLSFYNIGCIGWLAFYIQYNIICTIFSYFFLFVWNIVLQSWSKLVRRGYILSTNILFPLFQAHQSQPGFTLEHSCLHFGSEEPLKYALPLIYTTKDFGVTPSTSIKPFFIGTWREQSSVQSVCPLFKQPIK